MGMLRDTLDAMRKIIALTDELNRASSALRAHQAKIEELTERVIYLEAALNFQQSGNFRLGHGRPPLNGSGGGYIEPPAE